MLIERSTDPCRFVRRQPTPVEPAVSQTSAGREKHLHCLARIWAERRAYWVVQFAPLFRILKYALLIEALVLAKVVRGVDGTGGAAPAEVGAIDLRPCGSVAVCRL